MMLATPELNFRADGLDRCLHIAPNEYKGEPVLLLRQVDDFDLSSNSDTISDGILCIIGMHLQLPEMKISPF